MEVAALIEQINDKSRVEIGDNSLIKLGEKGEDDLILKLEGQWLERKRERNIEKAKNMVERSKAKNTNNKTTVKKNNTKKTKSQGKDEQKEKKPVTRGRPRKTTEGKAVETR